MAQFLKVSDSIVYSSLIVILYHKEAKRLIELWFVVILISRFSLAVPPLSHLSVST